MMHCQQDVLFHNEEQENYYHDDSATVAAAAVAECSINDPFHFIEHDLDPIMIAARSEYRDNNKAPRWRYCTEPIISILDKSVPNHAFFTHRKEHLNIIALGRTGDGKSTLLNDMLGKQVFHHKQSAKSQTKQVQTASGFWAPLDRFMHEKEDFGCYIHATDTPGFGDSLHRDDYFQSIIQQAMVDMALDDGIHCILLVFKISTNADIIFKTMDTFVQLISPLMPQAQPVQQHDDDDNNNNNNTSTHAQEQTAKSVWKNVLFVFTHVDLSHAHGYYTVNSKYHARKIALKSKISRALKEKYSVTVDVPMLWISTKHETCASLKKDSASTGECDCELRCKYHSDARRRFYEQVWKRRNDPFIMAT